MLPCDEANIQVFDSIFYVASDLQSVEEGLSSFSAEANAFLEINQSATSNSIVFSDEILNTTTTKEASALAQSILESFLSKERNLAFISTHHQDLKMSVYQSGLLVSAHMGFDKDRPNYKLMLGTPGESYALDIFKSLESKYSGGKVLFSRAREIIKDSSFIWTEELKKINQIKNELEQGEKELVEKSKEMDAKLARYEEDLKIKKQIALEKLEREVRKKNQQINRLLSQVKDKRFKKDVEREIVATRSDVRNQLDELKSAPKQEVVPTKDLITGNNYFSSSLQGKVILNEINSRKKSCLVTFKGKKINLPLNDLGEVSQRKNKNKSERVSVHIHKSTSSNLEVDCRGKNAEEFESIVTGVLLDVLNGALPYADIIHGHGDGILRKKLMEMLKTFPDLNSENTDGNYGSTRVSLHS
jgi:DNA mismatch repair protein MutS2